MSLTTVRPSSTITNGTSTIGGGAGSRHAALSDDSDTTYVDVSGAFSAAMVLGFTPPSLTSGSVVKYVLLRVKAKATAATSASLGATLDAGGPAAGSSVALGTTTLTSGVLLAGGDASVLTVGLWRAGGTTGSNPRLYEAYLDVGYVVPPTLTVDAPTGTLTDYNNPTVTWTATFDDLSTGQYAYDVRIFDATTAEAVGFDPETDTPVTRAFRPESRGDAFFPNEPDYPLGNNTSWQSDRLPNDDYYAYVRVANSVNGTIQWSDWESSAFTVDVSAPDAPAVVLTDQPSDLRVKVDVTPDNSPVATDGVLVQRSLDGTTWETVTAETTGSPVSLYDYFAPSGVSVSYRAFGWNDTSSGRLYSAPTSASITPTTPWRIVHPTDPTLSFAIDDRPNSWMRSVPSITKPARQSINQPLGRSEAVAVSDTRGADTGSITLLTNFAKLAELEALLDSDASALWLAGRDQDSWRDRWVAFGDQETTRVVDAAWSDSFDVTLPWTEVAEP